MNPRQSFHTRPDWRNIDVTAINRQPAHVPWKAYSSAAQALCGGESENLLSLNGLWRFMLCGRPEDVPENCWEDSFDRSLWRDIQVPGNWETQGFGLPYYTNVVFPWSYFSKGKHILYPEKKKEGRGVPNPPFLPEENPTGLYFRTFTLPQSFEGKELYLNFEGVETAYYLFVNGQPAGYAQDSKLPSEFDVTDLIRPGENSVALQVMRFADSTYLEDQDYWYLSGIFRPVTLLAKPRLHIVDYQVSSALDGNVGRFSADVFVSRVDGFADCTVQMSLFDRDMRPVAASEARPAAVSRYRQDERPTQGAARLLAVVENAVGWSPEDPALYTAVFALLSPEGEPLDAERCRVGFKKIQVRDGVVHLNGKRLVVRGVNRHEHCLSGGRCVPKEHMIREIRLMKSLNINAVRTCHYPNSPLWYDLCDEYGLLIVCECNLETHGVMGQLAHDPAWANQFLERAVRMVATHKNHACIYSWSLGNESGTGANHAAMAGFIREYDKDRLCQYEAGDPEQNISDIIGTMYAPVGAIMDRLTRRGENRPIILVEYAYQIRNSGGGLHKFRELTEKYPRFQGGFIWDWQDKCLIQKKPGGTEYDAYGGDFGEENFEFECPRFMTNNGIVKADLTIKPVALEVKQVYCPVTVEKPAASGLKDSGRYRIKNGMLFTDTSGIAVCYAVREDGRIIEQGSVKLPTVPAGESAEFDFLPDCPMYIDSAYTVEFSIGKRGGEEEMGFYQFTLPGGLPRGQRADVFAPLPEISIAQSANELIVSGGRIRAVFDRRTGLLSGLYRDGRPFLSGGREVFCRPYCGLNAAEGWGLYEVWDALSPGQTWRSLASIEAEPVGRGRALVTVTSRTHSKKLPHWIQSSLRYLIGGDGSIELFGDSDIPAAFRQVQRVGLEFTLPKEFDQFEYFGLGPNENYRDRKESARLGLFASAVENEHFPFNPPSENGGHEQTRRLTLSACGAGSIEVTGKPFHFDMHDYTIEDLIRAEHEHEIKRREEITLHLDAEHMGIGGAMAWSTALSGEEVLPAGIYAYRFVLRVK